MNAPWKRLGVWYDGLQHRERVLIAVAVLGGIVFVGATAFIEPSLRRVHTAERETADATAQLQAARARIAALNAPDQNPDAVARAEIAQLKTKLAGLNARVEAMETSFVAPQQMPRVLEDVIGRRGNVRLLSLKTLPVAPLLNRKTPASAESGAAQAATAGTEAAPPTAGLFKHGVEIRLEGSYQELAAYLERLEQSRSKFLWDSVALSAEKHPKLVLTLTVFTISMDRAWLVI